MAFQKSQWPEFEKAALGQLEKPQVENLLLLWRYPHFGEYTAWHLTNRGLERRTWNRPQDFLMVSEPIEGIRRGFEAQPTIQYSLRES